MAANCSHRCLRHPHFLALAILFLSLSDLALAARKAPEAPASSDKKLEKDCLTQEGTVLIPGIGRYALGSHEMPDFRGLDHSVPAAVHGQYIPGNDDTFVPNPGFEVPNPFRGLIP